MKKKTGTVARTRVVSAAARHAHLPLPSFTDAAKPGNSAGVVGKTAEAAGAVHALPRTPHARHLRVFTLTCAGPSSKLIDLEIAKEKRLMADATGPEAVARAKVMEMEASDKIKAAEEDRARLRQTEKHNRYMQKRMQRLLDRQYEAQRRLQRPQGVPQEGEHVTALERFAPRARRVSPVNPI